MTINEKRDPASETGTAMIEGAIIAPILFLLVFGIVQYGQILLAQMTLRSASAVAAREAAILQPSPVALTGAQQTAVYNAARNAVVPMLDSTRVTPSVTLNNVSSTNDGKKVTLTYPLPLLIPYVVGRTGGNITLTASSVAK